MKACFVKTIFLSAISTLIAFSAITLVSCEPDKCKSVVCAYGGVCNDGVCICPSGYEGVQCETIVRDKFLGIWQVIEVGSITNTTHFTVSVETDNSKITNVLITNFYNVFTQKVQAYVKQDTLYIPQMTYGTREVQGYGYFDDEGTTYGQHGKMKFIFSVKDNVTGNIDDFGLNGGTPAIWNK